MTATVPVGRDFVTNQTAAIAHSGHHLMVAETPNRGPFSWLPNSYRLLTTCPVVNFYWNEVTLTNSNRRGNTGNKKRENSIAVKEFHFLFFFPDNVLPCVNFQRDWNSQQQYRPPLSWWLTVILNNSARPVEFLCKKENRKKFSIRWNKLNGKITWKIARSQEGKIKERRSPLQRKN